MEKFTRRESSKTSPSIISSREQFDPPGAASSASEPQRWLILGTCWPPRSFLNDFVFRAERVYSTFRQGDQDQSLDLVLRESTFRSTKSPARDAARVRLQGETCQIIFLIGNCGRPD